MNILLVGANGQVGREIQELIKHSEFDLISFSHQQLEIRYKGRAIVINAAAYTAVDLAEDEADLAYAVNCEGVKNLALACDLLNLPLIHLSTDYVFSGNKKSPYTEDEQPNPQSVYGASKLAGEKILQQILPHSIILRVSWVFGKYGKNFVKTILRLARERTELNIVNDQIGNPTAAADIARVILILCQRIAKNEAKWGIYHYCGAETVSWYDFSKEIIAVAQSESLMIQEVTPIVTSAYPTKAIRPMSSSLNCDKVGRDFGIEQHSWKGYLKKVCEDLHE